MKFFHLALCFLGATPFALGATSVSGVISSDATWTASGSPYQLSGTVQVAFGKTLTIAAGATVVGGDRLLEIFGNLVVAGTAASRVTISNLAIAPGSNLPSAPSSMDIRFANIDGGSLWSPRGLGTYSSISIRDSTVTNLGGQMVYLWYPAASCFFERNVFNKSCGFSVGLDSRASPIQVTFRNNVFFNPQIGTENPTSISDAVITCWASYGTSVIVDGNSFLNLASSLALKLAAGYDSASITASNNYWGALDAAAVALLIFDKAKDLNSAGTIRFQPIRLTPDAATPTAPTLPSGPTAPVTFRTTVIAVAAGGYSHSLFVTSEGGLWAMGENSDGQLGDGTTTPRNFPVQIASGVRSVAAGYNHSLFVKGDGTMWAMGNNSQFQLGDGTGARQSSPVQVAAGVRSVAAGLYHSLFLRSDGSLWAVGDSSNGQLGDGTFTRRGVPVQVANSVTSVAAGSLHSAFVKSDNTLWCAGYGGHGQLGDGTLATRTSPIQVATSVSSVACGLYHTLFLKLDGTLWAMGENSDGQLGDGTTSRRDSPVQVASGVRAASAGDNHSMFVKTNGTLWAMGYNSDGQLGDGSTISRNSPVQVAAGVDRAAAGGHFSLFSKTDGTLFAAGKNNAGQLGDGTSISRTIPVGQVAPSITMQPSPQSVTAGGNVILAVGAAGSPGLTYQWSKDGVAVSGATGATLPLLSVGAAAAGSYTVVVSNSAGNATTSPAVLTVNLPPSIIGHPASLSLARSDNASFGVVASGDSPLSYQWFKESVPLQGATRESLTLSNVQVVDSGNYAVVVSNVFGSVRSNLAVLAVTIPNPGRIINMSILTPLASGENLTLGVVLGGAGTGGNKPLLVRAAGPSLVQFGIAGALADPNLDIFSGQASFASNDNWGGTTTLAAAFTQVGAFAFGSVTSRDSAVLNPAMPAGPYTVQVAGVGGTSGFVIAELYDSTPAGSYTLTTPRLVNVSLLKNINAGETLTAGFVIGGSTNRTVLLRVVGPSLGLPPFNIAGVMADPRLDLLSGQTVIGSNNDWGGSTVLSGAFANVGAFPLAGNTKDAALLVTLQPGSYTAKVEGVNGSGGLAIVEVYEVP